MFIEASKTNPKKVIYIYIRLFFFIFYLFIYGCIACIEVNPKRDFLGFTEVNPKRVRKRWLWEMDTQV